MNRYICCIFVIIYLNHSASQSISLELYTKGADQDSYKGLLAPKLFLNDIQTNLLTTLEGQRGHHIAAFDEISGNFTQSAHFDTCGVCGIDYAANDAAAESYLYNITPNKIVAVLIYDTGEAGNNTHNVLMSWGCNVTKPTYRSSFIALLAPSTSYNPAWQMCKTHHRDQEYIRETHIIPLKQPSTSPTSNPTKVPTSNPTKIPITTNPTKVPTSNPTLYTTSTAILTSSTSNGVLNSFSTSLLDPSMVSVVSKSVDPTTESQISMSTNIAQNTEIMERQTDKKQNTLRIVIVMVSIGVAAVSFSICIVCFIRMRNKREVHVQEKVMSDTLGADSLDQGDVNVVNEVVNNDAETLNESVVEGVVVDSAVNKATEGYDMDTDDNREYAVNANIEADEFIVRDSISFVEEHNTRQTPNDD